MTPTPPPPQKQIKEEFIMAYVLARASSGAELNRDGYIIRSAGEMLVHEALGAWDLMRSALKSDSE